MAEASRSIPPVVVSLLAGVGLFVFCLAVLRPGYAINDDLKITAIAAGYPGVRPSPFLIFSNVLLGFLLVPLYGLPTGLNWEIILFILVDVVSVCTLLYLVVSARASKAFRALGAVLLLACASYYALNITFSSTAALACFAGLCALLAAAGPNGTNRGALAATGLALVLAGSVIRIQMLVLSLPPILAAAAFFFRVLQPRRAALVLGGATLLVFGAFAFDRLYVRAHPDWNTFYFYNSSAMQIQDSHRLENMHLEIRRIGWSGNDQELFARYFFPDADTYSVDRLRYLVERIPGTGTNPTYTIGAFLQRITAERAAPPLLVCAAAWLLMLAGGRSAASMFAVPLVAAAALAENLALMWIYKNPEYVLLSSLANAAMLGVLILFWPALSCARRVPPFRARQGAIAVLTCALLTATLAVYTSARRALITSDENVKKQASYASVLADIEELRRNGKLAPDLVIVSSSHGIPWDWSNPLLVGFPPFTYLDTGWNTFSPHYEEAIRQHGVEPLPEALYERENVYLISKSIFQGFLARYYEEHHGIAVTFETLYSVPNPYHFDGYDGVELYKVVRTSQPLP